MEEPIQYLVWGSENTKSIDRLLTFVLSKGLDLKDATFIFRPTDSSEKLAVGFGWYEDSKPKYRIAVSLDGDKMTTRDMGVIERYLRNEYTKRMDEDEATWKQLFTKEAVITMSPFHGKGEHVKRFFPKWHETKTFEEAADAAWWSAGTSAMINKRSCGHSVPICSKVWKLRTGIEWTQVEDCCEPCLRKKLGYSEEYEAPVSGIPHDRDFKFLDDMDEIPDKCEYATPQPVLVGGERLETISEMHALEYSWQVKTHEDKTPVGLSLENQLEQESTYLRKRCSNSLTSYPICNIHGEPVSVEAQIADDTKMVTAMFMCEKCRIVEK